MVYIVEPPTTEDDQGAVVEDQEVLESEWLAVTHDGGAHTQHEDQVYEGNEED